MTSLPIVHPIIASKTIDPLSPLSERMTAQEIDHRIRFLAKHLYSLKGMGRYADNKTLKDLQNDFHHTCKLIGEIIKKIEITRASSPPLSSLSFEIAKHLWQRANDAGYEDWLQSSYLPVSSTGTLPPGSLNETDDKLLLHQHGDSFGLETGLEGEDLGKVMAFVKKFIEASLRKNPSSLHPQGSKENTISKMEQIVALLDGALWIRKKESYGFERNTNDLVQDIVAFIREKINYDDCVLIPGGWGGKPCGHGMYYEVQLQENGLYSFSVFNRGAGLQHHGAPLEAFHKLLYPAYLKLVDIKEEDLFNPHFLRGIVELKDKDADGKDFEIYEGLLPLLKGKVSKLDLELEDHMGPQKSGTCAWKSLTAFLRTRLTYREYKLFIYRIKQQSLQDYYKMNRKVLETDIMKRNLFEKSLMTFANTLEKIGKSKIIPVDEYEQAVLRLAELKNKLGQADVRRLQSLKQEAPLVSCEKKEMAWVGQISKDTTPKTFKDPVEYKTIPSNKLTNMLAQWHPSADRLNDDLEFFFQKFFDALQNGHFDDVHSAYLLVMEKFPVPEAIPQSKFWVGIQSLGPKKAAEAIETLSNLHDLFFKACHRQANPERIDPGIYAAMYKSLALQDAFIMLTSPELLGMPGFSSPPDFEILSSLLRKQNRKGKEERSFQFPLRDPQAIDDLTQVYRYFMERAKSISSSKPLAFSPSGNSPTSFFISDSKAAESFLAEPLNPEFIYMKKLLADKGIRAKIKKIDPEFAKLRLIEQIAKLYTDESLADLLPRSFRLYRRHVWQVQIATHYDLHAAASTPLEKISLSSSYSPPHKALLNEEYSVSIVVNQPSNTLKYKRSSFDKIYRSHYRKEYLAIDNLRKRTDVFSQNGILPYQISQEYSLLCTNREVQITETLALLMTRPELFKVPELQNYIEMLLFESDLMLDELRRHPEFIHKIIPFINKTLRSYQEQGNVEASTFLIKISRFIEEHWEYVCKKDPALCQGIANPSFVDPLEELKRLFQIGSLSDQEKSLLYNHLIAFSKDPERVDDSALEQILIGLSHMDKHSLPLKWRDPALNRKMDSTLQVLSERIQSIPDEQMAGILNAIVNYHNPHANASYQWNREDFPIFSNHDKSFQIDIFRGRLYKAGTEAGALPPEILESAAFSRVFDRKHEGRQISLDAFEIADTHGQLNRIRFISDSLWHQLDIEREIEGRWFKYSAPPNAPYAYLDNNFNLFKSNDDPLVGYYCNKEGRPCYRLNYNKTPDGQNKLIGIDDLLHEPPLRLIYIYQSRKDDKEKAEDPYDFLKAFELSQEIGVWEDADGQPKRIELPRFNLTFTAQADSQEKMRWECQEIKGYFLSEKQYVEPLAKLHVTSFLKLENEKGEVKVLIPRQNLDKESHGFKAARKFDRKENTQKFLVYDYQRPRGRWERELKMGPEEGLYMALLALSCGSDEGYRLARHLLDPNKFRVGKVHEEELEILNWICHSANTIHDHDPKAVALRLHALYLLNEQLERGVSQESTLRLTDEKDFWKGVKADLSRYATSLQHSEGYHLPIHELVSVCKLQMANSPLSIDVVHFLEQLDRNQVGKWAQNLSKLQGKSSYQRFRLEELEAFLKSPVSMLNFALTLISATERKKPEYKEKFWIRSNDPALFFLEKLPIAVNGSNAKKQELRERLKIMLGDRASIVYATILEMILDYPDCFPIPLGSIVRPEDVRVIASYTERIVKFAVHKYTYEEALPLIPKKMAGELSDPLVTDIVSKVPSILFGDAETFEASLEKVEDLELKGFLCKIDEKELSLKREKENQKLDIVHNDVKEILNIQTDRVGNKVIERLHEGCSIYLNKQRVERDEFAIVEERVDEMIESLGLHIQYRLQVQQQEAVRLCFYAESGKENTEGQLLSGIRELGGKRDVLTIDDLCLLYAKGDLKSKQELHLEKAIKNYLVEATYTQKLERIRQRAEEFKAAKDEDKATAEIALVDEMRKDRIIDMDLHPECLLLEFKANILMNETQYDNFLIFLKTGRIKHPIRHMIMGSGKTSVLMKLLALLRADGTRLSTLVLTDDLLESMSEEVRSGSVNTFDQLIVPFEIDRKTDLSIEKLKELKEKLQRVRRGKAALIMSPKSIHTFYLTLLETSFKSHSAVGRDRELLLEALGLQRKIMGIFLSFGSALLDEADILLNCRTEVNFPFGEETSIPMEEQELLLDLYDILLGDPEICDILKCDFHPSSAGENAGLYMQEAFIEKVRPRIVDAYLEKMITPVEGEAPDYKKSFEKYDAKALTHIRNYLLQVEDGEALEAAQIFVDNLKNLQVKNILSLLKEELVNLLPMSLEKNCGEHYNYSQMTALAYAIPCSSGRPNEGSRFSNAHETSNYTIQTSLKYGIQQDIIHRKLDSLQKRCIEELESGKRLRDAEAHWEFIELSGGKGNYHLAKLSDKDKQEIIHTINSDRFLQRKFQQQYALPAIRFHQRKINSNAHMLARFFGEIAGFSGTLWNADTFPAMLSPEAEHDVDAMTLFLLSSHLLIEKNGKLDKVNNVITISRTDGESVLQAAADALKAGINVLAIADNGGYMNDEDPDLLAKATTEKLHQANPQIMGTAYHDRTSTLVVNEKGQDDKEKMSQSLLKKSERVTIYLQPFTTGTDIKQASSAVQLLTIGRTTLLRDLFQTAWRMRELGQGQRIQFVVSNDIVKVILQKLSLPPDTMLTQDHIIKFCLLNQIEQLSDDTVVAVKMKMLNFIQWEVIKVLLASDISNEEASSLFVEEMKALFAPEQSTQAYDMYGKSNKKLPTEMVMKQELSDCMELLRTVVNKVDILKKRIDIDKVQEELAELISKELLPEKTLSPANETLNQQVQVQQKQKQKTKQREEMRQQEAVRNAEDRTRWEKYPWPQAAPEKIFDPSYYRAPRSAAAFRFIQENISIPLPPAQHVVAPILGVALHYQPVLTLSVGIAVGITAAANYALSKVSSHTPSFWVDSYELGSALCKYGKEYGKEWMHPFEVWSQGAPFPYSIGEYLTKEPGLNPLIPFIDKKLFVTHNFATPKAYSDETYVSKPLDIKSKNVREMLLMQHKKTGNWRVLMIDKDEADYFRNQLAQDKKDKRAVERALRICLYHPITGVIQQGAEAITDDEVQKNEALLEPIVQMKFLNGESKYTEPEWEALKKWIDKSDKKILEGIFKERILPTRIDAEDVWKKMQKLFQDMGSSCL